MDNEYYKFLQEKRSKLIVKWFGLDVPEPIAILIVQLEWALEEIEKLIYPAYFNTPETDEHGLTRSE